MELIDNKSQYWQGWNDFLGITKKDIENYLTNLIGDIIDNFKFNERKVELVNLLVSDTTNSHLVYSVESYRSLSPIDPVWMHIRIYYVDEYFITSTVSWDNVITSHYIGKDINFTVDSFYHAVEATQGLIKSVIYFDTLSQIDLTEDSESSFNLHDFYEFVGYRVPEFTEGDCNKLSITLSSIQKKNHRKD